MSADMICNIIHKMNKYLCIINIPNFAGCHCVPSA